MSTRWYGKAESTKMLNTFIDRVKGAVQPSLRPYAVKEAIDKDVFRERAQTSR